MYNLFNVMVEQACSSEGRVVDRARAWCSSLHVPLFRFNPQLSQDMALDEHEDESLVRAMWETRAYMRSQARTLAQLRPLLVGTDHLDDHDYPPHSFSSPNSDSSTATSSSSNTTSGSESFLPTAASPDLPPPVSPRQRLSSSSGRVRAGVRTSIFSLDALDSPQHHHRLLSEEISPDDEMSFHSTNLDCSHSQCPSQLSEEGIPESPSSPDQVSSSEARDSSPEGSSLGL